MKKHSQSPSPRGKSSRNQRENPEGVSILKRSKTKLSSSPSPNRKSPAQKTPKKKVRASQQDASFEFEKPTPATPSPKKSPSKRKGPAGDSTSFLEQTPESLSQISSIMPPDETMMSGQHSPSKKRRQSSTTLHASVTDETMELAVQYARGEPDGADQSLHQQKSPKKSKAARALQDIPEVEEEGSGTKLHNKENSTMVAQKASCMKVSGNGKLRCNTFLQHSLIQI